MEYLSFSLVLARSLSTRFPFSLSYCNMLLALELPLHPTDMSLCVSQWPYILLLDVTTTAWYTSFQQLNQITCCDQAEARPSSRDGRLLFCMAGKTTSSTAAHFHVYTSTLSCDIISTTSFLCKFTEVLAPFCVVFAKSSMKLGAPKLQQCSPPALAWSTARSAHPPSF